MICQRRNYYYYFDTKTAGAEEHWEPLNLRNSKMKYRYIYIQIKNILENTLLEVLIKNTYSAHVWKGSYILYKHMYIKVYEIHMK